jgi:glyoxylase-like metal-dependent hydrolase (beta-lactamase superfamily II)
MQVQQFFDVATSTLTYVVYDATTRDAVVIDSVLDYDPAASQTSTGSLEKVAAFVDDRALRVHYALETHAHADHISGAQYLRRRFDAKVAIGERIREVQSVFKALFDLPTAFSTDGAQFDRLLADGDVLRAGSLALAVIATPGHTPACVSYKIDDAVFTGDALFIEDYGTGRCDFPRGSASDLYTSVHGRLYALPDATRVCVGHDYQPGRRSLRYETTIGKSKHENIQLRATTTMDAFITLRTARDATLAPPRLLLPSVQINIAAGRLPAPHANGRRYLSIPLNLLRASDDVGGVLDLAKLRDAPSA